MQSVGKRQCLEQPRKWPFSLSARTMQRATRTPSFSLLSLRHHSHLPFCTTRLHHPLQGEERRSSDADNGVNIKASRRHSLVIIVIIIVKRTNNIVTPSIDTQRILGAHKNAFSTIENPSSLKSRSISDPSSSKTWSISSIDSILTALNEVDTLFSSRIQVARQHAVNQARIDALQSKAKKKHRETRQAILELSRINGELDEIEKLAAEEMASMSRAEKQPVGHATLLAYAQRLARYTSAPPGYKLPQLTTAQKSAKEDVKAEAHTEAEGAEEKLALSADYNQYAKRAAAYYDPAIPSMPQEMPFPSDAMMRQGILNSQAMLDGAPAAEQPLLEDGMAMEDGDELPEADFAASYSHFRDEQRGGEEDEDAFDLDLN